jgi:galactokinase
MILKDLETSLESIDNKLVSTSIWNESNSLEISKKRLSTMISEAKELLALGDTDDIHLYTSPGRLKFSGYYTEAHGGKSLSCTIDRNTLALIRPRTDGEIVIYSHNYELPYHVDLDDIEVREEERAEGQGLVRGVSAFFKENNIKCKGFDAFIYANFSPGSGINSSASFCSLLALALWDSAESSTLPDWSEEERNIRLARGIQRAEELYFGNPSDFTSPLTCLMGGMIYLDYSPMGYPLVQRIPQIEEISEKLAFLLIDTKGSYADLTSQATEIDEELRWISTNLGVARLSDASWDEIRNDIAALRGKVGDRTILRANYFYKECEQIEEAKNFLLEGNTSNFVHQLQRNAADTWRLLQNSFSTNHNQEQGIPLAMQLSEMYLKLKMRLGTVNIHGKGFSGPVLATIDQSIKDEYIEYMSEFFVANQVQEMKFRAVGTQRIF